MQDSQPTDSAENGITPWLGAQIQKVIDGIHQKYKDLDDGNVATYIPELGKADPKHFGICLATVEGEVFTAGDWDTEFTIQSMCKPFAFQLAMERHGTEKTLKHVGVEPSGEAFNSIEFDQKTVPDCFDLGAVETGKNFPQQFSMLLQQFQRKLVVALRQRAVPDHVGEHDGGELALFGVSAHGCFPNSRACKGRAITPYVTATM